VTPSIRSIATLALLIVTPCAAPSAAAAADKPKGDLAQALQSIVGAGALAGARTGVFVADAATGEPLFARDADVLLNPASNVKLVTTAAALVRLGPEYRFATELRVEGVPGASTAKALHVRGKGDPTLVSERLWVIAGELAHLGLRSIGDLVLDDRFFDAERIGPGFDQEEGDRSYLAPAGALSLNWNTVAIHVGPGERRGAKARVELEPASDALVVENRTTTVAARGARRLQITSSSSGGKQRFVVSGRIPLGSRTQVVWRRVEEPALYAGETLRRYLALRGVRVTGTVRLGVAPPGARLVHVSQSEPLSDVVRRLNKTSNNFVAEQLVKTLGAEVKGAPGSWAKGVAATEAVLAELGVPRGAYVMKNGSGLNDTNRFSARQLVTVLRAMWGRFPLHAEFMASLPVAARDGTIRYRMDGTAAAGRLRAKTGTLEGVTGLSGFVETAGGRTLAFAVLVNDHAGRGSGAVRAVDAIGAALAASGGDGRALGAAVASASAADGIVSAAAAPGDLAATARTYLTMGRAGDPRNVTFLRGALRTETDPALRLAIAESLYLSEPDGDGAARVLVDALADAGPALARLWAAMPEDDPPPVVASLGDLAGAGDPDAIARLVELAQPAAPGALPAAIADRLAEVAAASPEPLVGALGAALPATQESAIAALAAGIARWEEQEHPFPAALRALAAKESELAPFARALEPRLAEAIRAGEARRATPSLVPAAAGR
jgi:D-alanyl-D-alanine carboxypeptidase/D-alanyl-D-alanine-endopeptidase (penicillin-binding protein 4)